jgi:predicted RNase H-like nuclease (RuvC/YqgF family)
LADAAQQSEQSALEVGEKLQAQTRLAQRSNAAKEALQNKYDQVCGGSRSQQALAVVDQRLLVCGCVQLEEKYNTLEDRAEKASRVAQMLEIAERKCNHAQQQLCEKDRAIQQLQSTVSRLELRLEEEYAY